MKRSFILMLLLLIFAAGCGKKSETSTTNTSGPTATDSGHAVKLGPGILFTRPTTVIMPAAADNGKAMTLTMQAGGRTAMVSVYFVQGGANQTITVDYTVADVRTTITFTSTTLGQWTSLPAAIPSNATNVTVTAGGPPGNVNYNHSESYPVAAGGNNALGIDVSKYWDDGPNVAYIAVQDAAVTIS